MSLGSSSSRSPTTSSSPGTTPQTGSRAPIVVAIGASAGGLEAFSQLLASLPEHTGMAFVLLQHLDPKHPSLLPKLLSASAHSFLAAARSWARPGSMTGWASPPLPRGLRRRRATADSMERTRSGSSQKMALRSGC